VAAAGHAAGPRLAEDIREHSFTILVLARDPAPPPPARG
jgi:hypothetical protein